ncbi:EF-hand [Tilletiaria anomala UBC 951]|uniref:EF-hand n=1 Tax=Tilletiaria anomala (strain ATCC 24038 / CBS 436.72 / UBC 951) TaxID=1037660 RepID=A0A066W7L8_TILAU|nr:EF-hand [Tilletiaria anomala UBC 951]KDN49947.1 EF-hand [Tilletiaria anomala UBC 951]
MSQPSSAKAAPGSFLSPSAQASGTAAARLRNRQTNHPRQSSGVYNTFSHKQIQGFKEAFTMVDQDRDGLISREDLKTMLTNLGINAKPATLDAYMSSAFADSYTSEASAMSSAGVNFTQFLTMFGTHLSELDEAHELSEAFACFDEKDDGVLDAAELRYWLKEVGDRMTDSEIDRLLSGPFMDRGGKRFDYKAFIEAIKMAEPAELE